MRKTSVNQWLCLVTLFLGVNLKVQAQNWALTGNMNVRRAGHTATVLKNGEVLVAGGAVGASTSSAELYNPSTGTFSYTGSMNTGRTNHAAALLPSGEVLIVGGSSS
jgi:Kelch motif